MANKDIVLELAQALFIYTYYNVVIAIDILVLLFQSDKKLHLLVLVKNHIFLCHTFLATYKRLNFVTFLSTSLLDNNNRV